MNNAEIEDQDGEGNTVKAARKMIKLASGEFIIGMCTLVDDDEVLEMAKPMTVQMVPQGKGRIGFHLFPLPCDPLRLDASTVVGHGVMAKGIENSYIESTTGIKIQDANTPVANASPFMRQ